MTEKTKITGSEAIRTVGKELYGDKFNIDNPEMYKVYKRAFESFALQAGTHHFRTPQKGLMIIGGVGVGKTAMMVILQRLFKDASNRFKMVKAYELKDLSEVYTISQIKEMYGYDLKCDLYIDDIGVSMDVKRYGNTVNIITDILMERYDLFIQSGYKTHLSSNLLTNIPDNPKNHPTLKIMYGSRVVDRIREMCEIIIFKGDSQRK